MKRILSGTGRRVALGGVLLALLGVFGYTATRSGPLAPIPVTLVTVEREAVTPALFGIGTVEAQATHRIGPTYAGRVRSVDVHPGERVKKGQLLGEMDPVDLDDRIGAQDAALERARAAVVAAAAQVEETAARKGFAEAQATRYERLLAIRSVSEEGAQAKRQEQQVAHAAWSAARANLDVARQELRRLRAEREGLLRQRANVRLLSPVDGLVTRREADPGSTVVAGQAVIEVVEPASLWVSARFDQQRAPGLAAQLPARITLRSRGDVPVPGRVVRIEPHADPVTEEIVAKVAFDTLPDVLPPIGELVEVVVALSPRSAMPVVPNPSVQRVGGRLGVWTVADGDLRFVPVTLGAADLDGRVQVVTGLDGGERVVRYSHRTLSAGSRIEVVEHIMGKTL